MQEIKEMFRDSNNQLREEFSKILGYETPELIREFTRRRQEAEKRLEDGVTDSLTIKEARRIGRNSPCPCGSNIKFKKCCGVGFSSTDTRIKD